MDELLSTAINLRISTDYFIEYAGAYAVLSIDRGVVVLQCELNALEQFMKLRHLKYNTTAAGNKAVQIGSVVLFGY